MQIILKFELTEFKHRADLSVYNYICYDIIRANSFGYTRLIIKFDDVSECPEYELGTVLENGKFNATDCGWGDEGSEIPEEKDCISGRYLEITLY